MVIHESTSSFHLQPLSPCNLELGTGSPPLHGFSDAPRLTGIQGTQGQVLSIKDRATIAPFYGLSFTKVGRSRALASFTMSNWLSSTRLSN